MLVWVLVLLAYCTVDSKQRRMCFLYSNTVLYSCMLQESDLILLNDCLAAVSLLDSTNKSGTTVLDYGIRAFCIIRNCINVYIIVNYTHVFERM